MLGHFSVYRVKQNMPAGKIAEATERAVVKSGGKCACCGIGVPKSAGLAFIDSNPNNLIEENVVSVCKICEALHAGGRLNADTDYGDLIYFPQLSQIEIVRLAHAYYSLTRLGEHIPQLTELKAQMRKLTEVAKMVTGTNNPDDLADILFNMKPVPYSKRDKALGGIRYWPDVEKFRKYLVDYSRSFLDKAELTEYIKKIK